MEGQRIADYEVQSRLGGGGMGEVWNWPQRYLHASVSPDGTRVALACLDEDQDIWIWHIARETLTRWTFAAEFDGHPVWIPDRSRVVFTSQRDGGGMFWKAGDGTGIVERLLESEARPTRFDWSADGRLVFHVDPGNIGLLSVEGDRTSQLVLDTGFVERFPAIAPDGRWIAYESSWSSPDFPDRLMRGSCSTDSYSAGLRWPSNECRRCRL